MSNFTEVGVEITAGLGTTSREHINGLGKFNGVDVSTANDRRIGCQLDIVGVAKDVIAFAAIDRMCTSSWGNDIVAIERRNI